MSSPGDGWNHASSSSGSTGIGKLAVRVGKLVMPLALLAASLLIGRWYEVQLLLVAAIVGCRWAYRAGIREGEFQERVRQSELEVERLKRLYFAKE
jgi:hypothetical protein